MGAEHFDLLVVGGGINGAGVARDAVLRGLRVALVEREDFASGTSSRSSRLIHGGVRYLEHGYLSLVFEASRERRILLRVAPHLVRPLAFTWPVYRNARVPLWKLRAGLGLYDLLSLFRNVAPHKALSARDVQAAEPEINATGLTGGARYYDASTNDARLTLANVLAAQQAGAAVLNYASVTSLIREGGRVAGAIIRDERTQRELAIRADVVVNTAGPWSDEIRALDEGTHQDGVRGTKGTHVSVPRVRLGNRDAVTLLSPLDGRVMFVLPAGQHTIIGTTDIYTDVSPSQVRATTSEVQYLLDSANAFFPAARLTQADVVCAWAGIRPLMAGGTPGDAASASREHAVHLSASGVVSVSGGKLTTYRAMAAEIVSVAARGSAKVIPRSLTARVPLPGGAFANLEGELAAAHASAGDGLIAAHLVGSYGSQWRDVWAQVAIDPSLGARVTPELPYTFADFTWAATHEMAWTLADLLVRRTWLAFEMRDQGRAVAPAVAEVVRPLLGWSDAEVSRQLDAYDQEVNRLFSIDPT